MKNPILTIVIVLVLVMNSYSQGKDSTITRITFQDGKYYQGGQIKTRSEIKTILANNSASAPEYHKFKTNNTIGFITLAGGGLIAGTGGIIFLFSATEEFVNGINGEKINNPHGLVLLLAGTACTLTGVAVIVVNPHFKRAIDLYNSNVKSAESKPVQFSLGFNSNGLGMRMTF
jgi:hypothetical protein